MTDYSALSDETLLEHIHLGDKDAADELVMRYRPIIKKCTRPYFLVGGDSEDLIQEGMIGLIRSIQKYDESKNCSFSTYAQLCIRRRVLSAIKTANRNKHSPLNSGLSLEELYEETEDAQNPVSDELYSQSPEQLFIKQEEKSRLYRLSGMLLSSLEYKILTLYLEGLSYEEIAESCGKPIKSVDSALQRIKKKLADAASQKKI